MKYLILLAFVFLSEHDIPVAYFELHLDKVPHELSIEMDARYLYLMIDRKQDERALNIINEYFSNNLQIQINESSTNIALQFIETLPNGHLKINGLLEKKDDLLPSSILIKNTCFVEVVDRQINSLLIYQKDKDLRGFKMDQERIEINIDL